MNGGRVAKFDVFGLVSTLPDSKRPFYYYPGPERYLMNESFAQGLGRHPVDLCFAELCWDILRGSVQRVLASSEILVLQKS